MATSASGVSIHRPFALCKAPKLSVTSDEFVDYMVIFNGSDAPQIQFLHAIPMPPEVIGRWMLLERTTRETFPFGSMMPFIRHRCFARPQAMSWRDMICLETRFTRSGAKCLLLGQGPAYWSGSMQNLPDMIRLQTTTNDMVDQHACLIRNH